MLVVIYSRIFELQRPKEAKTFGGSGYWVPRKDTGPLSTLRMLCYARQMGLSNPKDRIYAFMALPTTDGALSACALKPDYREQTSYLDVYREFAVRYLEKTSDLDLLCHVDHRDNVDHEDEFLNPPDLEDTRLSSWIPRRDRGRNPRNTFFVHMKRKIQLDLQQCTIFDTGQGVSLRVRAMIFNSVAWAAEKTRYIPPDNVLETKKNRCLRCGEGPGSNPQDIPVPIRDTRLWLSYLHSAEGLPTTGNCRRGSSRREHSPSSLNPTIPVAP